MGIKFEARNDGCFVCFDNEISKTCVEVTCFSDVDEFGQDEYRVLGTDVIYFDDKTLEADPEQISEIFQGLYLSDAEKRQAFDIAESAYRDHVGY